MPAQPSRGSPGHKIAPSASAAAFTADDVTAFRLRPLGHISTSSAPPLLTSSGAASVASTSSHPTPRPPLPTLPSHTPSRKANAGTVWSENGVNASVKHAASYPAPQHRKHSRGKEKSDGNSSGGLQVPRAAVPRVYAALVPSQTTAADATTAAGDSTTSLEDDVDDDTVNDRKRALNDLPGRNTAASASASAAHAPVPASDDIAAPNLRPAEVQELAQWTRDAAALRDVAATAAHKPKLASLAAATLLPVETSTLHHWWRERLGLRLRHRATAALFRELSPALEGAVRSTLTAEEAYWQQQRTASQARGIMQSSPASTAVPAGKMEALMRAVQLMLHQTAVSFAEAQMSLTSAPTATTTTSTSLRGHEQPKQALMEVGGKSVASSGVGAVSANKEGGTATTATPADNASVRNNNNTGGAQHTQTSTAAVKERDRDEVSDRDDGDVAALAQSERVAVLEATLNAERELVAETKAAASVLTTPSVVTLPPESPIPPPVLRMETAVSATLLGCILEQAEANTPGMTFALHLLHHYLLPHIYLDYAAWLAVRPRMGGLSEQVTHLATVPLRVHQQHDVVAAATQAQGDTRYFEAVVRAWTMKSWLRCVVQERQRVAQCAAFELAFHRLQRRLRLRRDFAAWQHRTRVRRQRRQEAKMAADFHQFVSASQATTGLDDAARGLGVLALGGAPHDGGPGRVPAPAVLTWGAARTTPTTTVAANSGSPTAASVAAAAPGRGSAAFANSNHSLPFANASGGSRKRGAGHSRVYVSFMRPKNPSTLSEAAGEQTPTREAEAELGVERFVVRHSDSDVDDEDDEAAGNFLGDPELIGEVHDEDESAANPTGPRAHRGGVAAGSKSVRSSGGASLMYLEAPKTLEEEEVAFPTFLDVDVGPTSATPRHRKNKHNHHFPNDEGNNNNNNNNNVTVAAPPTLFTTMMAKLQEMEEVNTYLRRELAVQSRRLRKVEADNNGLRQRNKELEEGTLRLVREKLEACNTAQQHTTTIAEKTRQIRQLRSRLRAHRHRPWQQAVMRLVGDVCAVSTSAAERVDEARVRHDRFGTLNSNNNNNTNVSSDHGNTPRGVSLQTNKDGRLGGDGAVGQQQQQRSEWVGAASHATSSELVRLNDGREGGRLHQQTATASSVGAASGGGTSSSGALDVPAEEERLFGRIAPIVLQSTKQLPEARVILADWANSCLDDLQRLDDLNGGPLAQRFVSFSEEARSGLLLSRLLYYLALPRYRAQTSAADANIDVPKNSSNGMGDEDDESQTGNSNWTGMDPRRQLLEQHGVQLDPPFPVFEDCFNDILSLSPVDRMLQLLAFATELLTSQAGDPVNLSHDLQTPDDVAAAFNATTATAAAATSTSTTPTTANAANPSGGGVTSAKEGGGSSSPDGKGGLQNPSASTTTTTTTAPSPVVLPAAPQPLHAVVDPYALARGESGAVVTFIALLYVRFAHPFHHKSRLCAAQERRMLLQLWSGGDATAEELAGPLEPRSRAQPHTAAPLHGSLSNDSLISFLPMGNDSITPAAAAAADGSLVASAQQSEEKGGGGNGGPPQRLTPPERAIRTTNNDGAASDAFSIEAEMLRQLAPEDKTPWQLFRERCLPVFGTQAHPFLLRGGFWPAEAFDTPELAAMLGALAMALHRSLELHRWHITLSCLVPVRTYSGLSRGVFTGPNASAAALELGLRQNGQEWLCLDFPMVRRCVEVRQAAFRTAAAAAASHSLQGSPVSSPRRKQPSGEVPTVPSASFKPAAPQEEIRALLTAATSVWQEDLLALFTQRATLSPQLALPVLDLGSWRLLCSDLGLIDMSTLDEDDEEDPDNTAGGGNNLDSRHAPQQQQQQPRHLLFSPAPSRMQQRVLDMEIVTVVFQRAVMAVARERDEVDPAVFNTSMSRRLQAPPVVGAAGAAGEPPRESLSMDFVLGVSALQPPVSKDTGNNRKSGGEAGVEAGESNSKTLRAANLDGAAGISATTITTAALASAAGAAAERVVVPDIQMDMTYAAFVLALTLLADELFPGAYIPRLVSVPLSPASIAVHQTSSNNSAFSNNNSSSSIAMGNRTGKTKSSPKEEEMAIALDITDAPPTSLALQYCSLPMAFAEFMRCVVLASPLVHLNPHDPRSVLRRLTSGLPTQLVLHRHSPALLLVYQAYSKDIFGEEGLLREDVLRLLRDAMLTSAELSQYLVFDLFASCAVLRQASEEAAVGVRRDIDGRLRHDATSATAAAARKPGYKAVRIVDPGATSDNTAAAAAQRRRAYVLTFEGFCDLVCVLCSFKQPNVFVPFEERLTLFLRRSLLRPLTHTVPGLGVLMSQSQPAQEASAKEAAVAAADPSTASQAPRPPR